MFHFMRRQYIIFQKNNFIFIQKHTTMTLSDKGMFYLFIAFSFNNFNFSIRLGDK